MEIDLAPVRRLKEAVVLKTIEPGDLAVRRHLVALHAARALTRMVLEAAACRIEGIAQSDVDVLMRLVTAGVAVDHYLLAWNADFDNDVEEVALGVLTVQRLDHVTADRKSVVEERVCTDVCTWVVAGSRKKKNKQR